MKAINSPWPPDIAVLIAIFVGYYFREKATHFLLRHNDTRYDPGAFPANSKGCDVEILLINYRWRVCTFWRLHRGQRKAAASVHIGRLVGYRVVKKTSHCNRNFIAVCKVLCLIVHTASLIELNRANVSGKLITYYYYLLCTFNHRLVFLNHLDWCVCIDQMQGCFVFACNWFWPPAAEDVFTTTHISNVVCTRQVAFLCDLTMRIDVSFVMSISVVATSSVLHESIRQSLLDAVRVSFLRSSVPGYGCSMQMT